MQSTRKPLTEMQRAVLPLIARGLRDKEIAVVLERSPITIKCHVKEILRRLGARNRAEAAAMAVKAGMA